MIGLRNAIWISLGLWLLLFAAAHAQQATPTEQIGVLSTRLGIAERSLNEAYLALIREQARSAALTKEVEGWRVYAKPLYAPAPAPASPK